MSKSKGPKEPDGKRAKPQPQRKVQADLRQLIAADQMLQVEICSALESLADSLPAIADLRLARALGSVLEPSWAEHVSFQDKALFPILMRRCVSAADLTTTLDRLRLDHVEISERNREVGEQIDLLFDGRRPEPGMFGYLLRNAFEGRRRHVESESTLVEAFLPSLLAPADRALLDAWHAARPQPLFPLGLLFGIRN